MLSPVINLLKMNFSLEDNYFKEKIAIELEQADGSFVTDKQQIADVVKNQYQSKIESNIKLLMEDQNYIFKDVDIVINNQGEIEEIWLQVKKNNNEIEIDKIEIREAVNIYGEEENKIKNILNQVYNVKNNNINVLIQEN